MRMEAIPNDSLRSGEVADLLAALSPDTDLPGLVERVHRDGLRVVVVPPATLAAWESRDAAGWAQVLAWLTTRGVAVVQAKT
jgi:hypothetical protein